MTKAKNYHILNTLMSESKGVNKVISQVEVHQFVIRSIIHCLLAEYSLKIDNTYYTSTHNNSHAQTQNTYSQLTCTKILKHSSETISIFKLVMLHFFLNWNQFKKTPSNCDLASTESVALLWFGQLSGVWIQLFKRQRKTFKNLY